MRVLGYPLMGLLEAEGEPAQRYSILASILASGASFELDPAEQPLIGEHKGARRG